MSLLVQATSAPNPKTQYVKIGSIALAGFFVILVVTQLYSFEEFPDVVASFWLPGGRAFAELCAALLVTGEVLALPFLLFMRLSPAMCIVSMAAGWSVTVSWLAISLWVNLSVDAVTNSGVLGATISVAPGWWTVALFTLIGIFIGWVALNTSLVRRANSDNEL